MEKEKLFNKDFILVIVGQIISLFGSSLLRFSLSLYILDSTGRADMFALLIAISTLPIILLSPLGGAIADRFNRRNLMVILDIMSGTILLLFAFTSIYNITIISIGILMTLLAVISSIYQPTVQASIPVLVSNNNLVKANGIVNGIGALSNFMAPVLGGVLYGIMGIKATIYICIIAFILSAIMEIFIRMPFVKRIQQGGMVTTLIKEMKDGIYYITKQNRFIPKIMLLALGLNMILTPFFIIGIPYIIKITMNSSSTMFGVSEGIMEISTILGALGVGFLSKKMQIENIYKWLLTTCILMIPMIFAVSPQILAMCYWFSYILLFICVVPIIMIVTMISIFVITEIQKITPNEYLGKVLAIITTVAQCAAPLGQLAYGGIFEVFSFKVYIPVLLMGCLTLLISIVGKSLLRSKSNPDLTHIKMNSM